MEEEDPELDESDPEDEGQPDNEELAKRSVDGSKEEEETGTVEEQQENTDEEEDWHTCSEEESEENEGTARSSGDISFHNSSRLLRKDELLKMFKATHNGPRCKDGQLTVGLVGWNVAWFITITYFPLKNVFKVSSNMSPSFFNCFDVFVRLGILMWERVPPSTLF